MEENTWFEIPYRDKNYKKYTIEVRKLRQDARDGEFCNVIIFHESDLCTSFKIFFGRDLISKLIRKLLYQGDFGRLLGSDNNSPFIRNLLLDYLFGKELDSITDEISFHTESPYLVNFDYSNDRIIRYKRNPKIIANENRFARKIVLKTLFDLQSNRNTMFLLHECHYELSVMLFVT